ncbi:NAD(P)-dependent oxidoreductase [Vibrio cholerae]|uniref:NAD(P)-dependent oxidoreductase n=1 Tax=Vibrio cholerae TaxID=666 RepID=UPI003967D787
MPKLLITGDVDLSAFVSTGLSITHIKKPTSRQDILAELSTTDFYVIGGPEYCSGEFLRVAEHLKAIVVLGTGTSSFVDVFEAQRRGIIVFNTPGQNAESVAEFALATLIHRASRFHLSYQSMCSGDWYQTPHKSLADIKVGCVGMGNINQCLVKMLRSFSQQKVLYYATKRKPELDKALNLQFTSLNRLFQQCDAIVVSVTGSSDTNKLIDWKVLSKAKPNLDLLHFSAPHVICPNGLKKALENKVIRSAYMDGYYGEWVENPGANNDPYGLLSLPPSEFIATTHIAAQTHQAISAVSKKAALLLNIYLQENTECQ